MSSISRRKKQTLLDRIAGRRVLVIGDLMLDHYIWGNATRISPEAPVPVVEVARDSYVPGGAANVAANCASLGARVTVAGSFGDDEAGRHLRAALTARGVQPVVLNSAGPTHPAGNPPRNSVAGVSAPQEPRVRAPNRMSLNR